MKTEPHNPGISLRVPDGTCENLCGIVSAIPGVVITLRRRPFWWVSDGWAEFTFRGHTFTITPDEWDGVYWIMSKDLKPHVAEMEEVRTAIETFEVPKRPRNWIVRRLLGKGIAN